MWVLRDNEKFYGEAVSGFFACLIYFCVATGACCVPYLNTINFAVEWSLNGLGLIQIDCSLSRTKSQVLFATGITRSIL